MREREGAHNPPPPPDLRGISSSGFDYSIWVGGFIALLLFAAFIFACLDSDRIDAEIKSFMSSCIEFNSVDRCRDLIRYDRRDLAMRGVRK